MSKQLDNYWKREIGRELTCKCGRTHYKERRPKSNTCKQCLADQHLNKVLYELSQVKSQVYRLISVWQCPTCSIVKPCSEFPGTGDPKGRCKSCENRARRAIYVWKITPQEREWRKLARYGTQTDIQLIICADCGEYEVRKSSFFLGCFCRKCFSVRKKRGLARLSYMNNYVPIADCIHCGNSFVKQLQSQRVCCSCTEKRKSSEKRIENQRYRAIKRGGRVKGVTYDPYDVFNRDKWKCYMCGVKTQKKDIYADNAAEIDHVIPLSKGGNDIPSNVKCSCRKCNIGKADKIIPLTGNLFCQSETG